MVNGYRLDPDGKVADECFAIVYAHEACTRPRTGVQRASG